MTQTAETIANPVIASSTQVVNRQLRRVPPFAGAPPCFTVPTANDVLSGKAEPEIAGPGGRTIRANALRLPDHRGSRLIEGSSEAVVVEHSWVAAIRHVSHLQFLCTEFSKEAPGLPRGHPAGGITVEGEDDRHVVCARQGDDPLGLGLGHRSATRGNSDPAAGTVDADHIDRSLAHDE